MGYSTDFKGELKFATPISSEALGYLNGFLGKDRRDIGLGGDDIYAQGYSSYWYHVDYELLDDFSGIKWNDSEKSYDMVGIANFLIDKMKEKYTDFGLTGKLIAQGEDIDDRWELVIENGRAVKKETRPSGSAIICPHCEGKVYVDEAKAA
jgi:hypothetical protein